MCLLVDDMDMQPTMARLPMGAHANAVRWSPDGGVLAVAVAGVPVRSSCAAERDAGGASAHVAKRGSERGRMPGNEAEEVARTLPDGKAAVLLMSACGAGPAHAAQYCSRAVACTPFVSNAHRVLPVDSKRVHAISDHRHVIC